MQKTPGAIQKAQSNSYKPGGVNVTYLLAIVLLAGWAIGFFVFHAGNGIHLLLAMAMLAILVNIIREG